MIQRLITVVALASIAEAYTVFTPYCTTANQTISFVRSPDTRGTLDILWSCLFTIFACTWTIQHLNIPLQRREQDPGWRGDLKWLWMGFWTKLKWMLVTMLAPELILGNSWGNLAVAKSDLPALLDLAASDGVEWSLTHSMFADMGGFIMVGNTGQESEVLEKTDIALSANSPLKPYAKASAAEEVGVAARPRNIAARRIRHEDPFHLTAAGIIRLRRAGRLPKLPSITIDEIEDKSKSDAFARTISIIQIGWISIQAIARAIRHLPVSQLEIAVVAFSVCAIIIYGLCWPKLKGVSVPYTLLSFPNDIPQEIIQEVLKSGPEFTVTESVISTLFYAKDPNVLGSPIANDCNAVPETGASISNETAYGLMLGCLVFGGLHLAAWNFHFPTTIEQTIWRATSIYTTVYMLVAVFSGVITTDESSMQTWLLRTQSVLYVLARLFLLVEIFRSLFFLPPEAYLSTWAANIPHLS